MKTYTEKKIEAIRDEIHLFGAIMQVGPSFMNEGRGGPIPHDLIMKYTQECQDNVEKLVKQMLKYLIK